MALTRTKARGGGARFTVTFDYDTADGVEQVNLIVDSDILTGNDIMTMHGIMTMPEDQVGVDEATVVMEMLARSIVEWDVLDRDPEPGESADDVPRAAHDVETLLSFPQRFLSTLLEHIREVVMRPPELTTSTSS